MSNIFSNDVLHLIDLPKKYYLANELYVDASLLLDTSTKEIILAQNNSQGYFEILRIGGGQLQFKQSCDLLSDANISLSGNPIIDGIPAIDGYRILLINQTNPIENGIWQITTGGIWVRPVDFENGSDAASVFTFIQQGTNYADTSWVCSDNTGNAVVGTDPLTWVQFGASTPSIIQQGMGIGSSMRIGNNNNASGDYSTTLGQCNTASACSSTVSGGFCNTASGEHSVIGGGFFNTVSGVYGFSSIVGGSCNNINGDYSTIGGGGCNTTSGDNSTISGGYINCAFGGSSVGGGVSNCASGNLSTISGGQLNTASGNCSFIGGGKSNNATSCFSIVTGGICNSSLGDNSFIGAGLCNTISSNYGAILGGSCNNVSGCFSGAFGFNLNACNALTFYTNNHCACGSLYSSTINSGCAVCATTGGQLVGYTPIVPPPATNYGLFSQTANSIPVAATTIEGTLIGTGVGTLSVPANGFSIGDSFRAELGGYISSKNNDTITIRVKSGSVILADSGPLTLPLISNQVWLLYINFTIRSIGASTLASIVTIGELHILKLASGTQQGFGFNSINNTTFDTTTSNTLDITVEWSTNSALNTIYSDLFVLNKIY